MGHSGDGTGWDSTDPANDEVISDGAKEIRDLRTGVGIRVDKEHVALATDSAGGEHKPGSAKAYNADSTAPTTRPDGEDLSNEDEGRLWVDSNNILKWYTGSSWVSLVPDPASEGIITGDMIVDGTIHSDKLEGLHNGITNQGGTGELKADVDGLTIDFNNVGDGGNQLRIKPGSILFEQLSVDIQPHPYALIVDQKDAAVEGGPSISGSWQTRDLTDIKNDTGLWNPVSKEHEVNVTLADNIFHLQAGTWSIKARVPSFGSGKHQARLATGAGAVLVGGSTGWSANQGNDSNDSWIIGVFTLTVSTDLKIEYRVSNAKISNGLGVAADFGIPNIYTAVELWRITPSPTTRDDE